MMRVRSLTKYKILKLLSEKPRTAGELARELGLKPSTIYTLLRYYRSQYLVKKEEIVTLRQGRNPCAYTLTNKGRRDIVRLREFYGW